MYTDYDNIALLIVEMTTLFLPTKVGMVELTRERNETLRLFEKRVEFILSCVANTSDPLNIENIIMKSRCFINKIQYGVEYK